MLQVINYPIPIPGGGGAGQEGGTKKEDADKPGKKNSAFVRATIFLVFSCFGRDTSHYQYISLPFNLLLPLIL